MRQGLDNPSAQFTGSFDYSAFGEQIGGRGGSSSPYGWGAQSGYRQDGGSGQGDCGLVLMGARWYDPSTGRFTSRDSDISQNAYVYCGGDPINFTDPSGHAGLTTMMEGAGLMIAGAAAISQLFSGLGLVTVLAALTFPVGLIVFATLVGIAYTGILLGAHAFGEGAADGMSSHTDEIPADPKGRDPREPVAPKGMAPGIVSSPTLSPLYSLNGKTGMYDNVGSTMNPQNYPTLPPGSTLSGH